MGETSIVFGRISTYGKEEIEHNISIISELPSEKEGYSMFTNEMFNRNTLNGKMNYTFGFPRSYKNIEYRWENWIDEFEQLIRKLKWETINVILETEMFGTHQYFWQKKVYRDNQEVPVKNDYGLIEKEGWYFGGGHRNFWGMGSNYGWENEAEEIRTFKSLIHILDKELKEESNSKLKKVSDKEYIIKTDKSGFKKTLSKLLKMYVNEAEKQTDFIPKSEYKETQLFSSDSEINIKSIHLKEGKSETKWINNFVDELIENKKKKDDH